MRILWLSHFVPFPPTGGAMQRAFHLLRHAASRHEVHLLALHQPRLLPTAPELARSIEALSALCATVRVFPLPAELSRLHRVAAAARSIVGDAPFDVTWLRSGAMDAALMDRSARPDVDLVHVDTVGLWPYVEGWDRTPVALGHHNIESDLVERRAGHERSSWRSALLRRDAAKLRAVEKRAVRHAAVNLVVSPLDGARLAALVPEAAVQVVENGVDTDEWQPSADPGPAGGIVFAGTLGWYPNRDAVEFLLGEIWPALVAAGLARRLVLVGRDAPPAARAAAAADSRVQVTGFVPDARPYLRAATVSVCPIRVGGGTRLKILDALAMAKPVVSTAIGVEGLDLVEGEHYLRAETAPEFVAQIDRLQRDPALRHALGAAGRRLVVARHEWRVIGRQLDAAYARAVAPPATHAAAV